MSAFEQLVGGNKKRPAAKTLMLLPEYFSEQWGNRPTAPFSIGIRVPSEQDYRNALVEAEKAQADARDKALRDPHLPTRLNAEGISVQAYNIRLLTFCVARGVCNAMSVTDPHPYFELADDEIPLALKSNAIRRIFDEIELLAVEQSPVFPEADEMELFQLAEILATDSPFEELDATKRGRCLRYAKLILDTLRE